MKKIRSITRLSFGGGGYCYISIFKYNKKISLYDNIWLLCKYIQNKIGASYTRSINSCPLKFRILILLIIQEFEFMDNSSRDENNTKKIKQLNQLHNYQYDYRLCKLIQRIKQSNWSLAEILCLIELIDCKSNKKLESYLIKRDSIYEINSTYSSLKLYRNGILSKNLFDYIE